MSVLKTQVFIASRFEEFAEIRSQLRERIDSFKVFPLEAVDFNDGRVSSCPPLENCVNAVRQAEVMILLVGESYGSLPAGQELSYTHLEYRTAIEQDSNTTVIPFFIGTSYQSKNPPFSKDPLLDRWQREILENHTPGFLDCQGEPHQLAEQIFVWAWKHLHDARDKTTQHEMQIQRETELSIDAQESSVTDELSSGLPPEDMAFLEGKFEDGESSEALFQETSDSAFPTMESLLRNPAAVAAQEQIAEARKAIGFGERSIAIGHLRKALEYKPLDIWASYTLAQLLMQSGRKKDCRDAFTIASRAGKMAQHDGRKIRAADCFMLAAKAANAAGDPGSGLSSALKATEITPWLAAARIELACQYLSDNNISEAISQAKFAFQIHPVSIQNLMHETQFIQRPDLAKQVFDTTTAMAEKWLKSLSHCQSSASKLAQSTGMKDCQPRGRNPESAEDKNPVALSYRCRLLSLECLRLLGRVAAKVKDMHVEFGQAKELASYRPVPGYSVKLFLRESVCIDVVEKLPVGTNVSKYLPVIFGKHTPEKVFQIAPFEGVIEKYYLESDKIVAVDIYQFSGAGSNTAESDAESSEAALKAAVSSFCRNLVEYEKTINASQSIMPAPSIHRAKVGGLVRYDKKTAADREDLVIDSHPLPENMRGFVDESAFAMDNRFYLMRVTAMTSGKLYLSRWRTYFG